MSEILLYRLVLEADDAIAIYALLQKTVRARARKRRQIMANLSPISCFLKRAVGERVRRWAEARVPKQTDGRGTRP